MRAFGALLAVLLRYATAAMALASAFLSIAAIGAALDPQLDVLTHFAPAFCWSALAAATIWWLAGRRGFVTPAACVLALSVCLGLIWPDIAGRLAWKSRPDGETVKIVQYNIWAGNKNLSGSASWLLAQDADFIVLQEADGAAPGLVPLLAKAYPFSAPCDRRGCPTVILSRRAPVDMSGFRSRTLDPFSGGWARYELPGGPMAIAAVHLERPYPYALLKRQSDELPGQLSALDRKTLILAGDFNLTPWSFTLKKLDQDLGLARRTHLLSTWPTPSRPETGRYFPAVLGIDHVYAGDAWRTVRVRRGPNLGSDHYPVVVTLTRDRF